MADTIANLSSADRVAALFAAYEGSLNNHILAQFRKNVQHEIKHFQSQYPIEDKADCNKNFSRALQAELTDICVSPELANMLKITAISNSGKDAHYQSAREAMYIFLCPDAIPANRPVVNDAHMPSGGTSVPIQQIKNKNTIVASPPQTDWTHSLDKNGRLDPYKHEALLNGVGHQMIEQTELHTGRRIVLNMTDSPPWFSSLPEKQLKKAEKLGVQATTDIVVFLRNKGIEVVFFKHGKRRRFWELVEADLRFRHPFQSGLKFHSMLRSDDLVLQADGFNPRKR